LGAQRTPKLGSRSISTIRITASRRSSWFGLTLLVTPSGTIRKVFFDRAALVPDERRCIGERLRGASYRGMTGLVELHARVDASGPSLRAARPARKGR